MDPLRNPYAPGAGAPPPELAGRQALLESAAIAIERIRIGRFAKSLILVGLRGVGKTVLLDRIRMEAEARGAQSVRIEAPEGRSLPALLAPQLRGALLRMSKLSKAKDLAQRALRALAGFAPALKVTYSDIEVALDFEREPGLADSGDLDNDLQELLLAAGRAAQAAGSVLVLFVDELQYVREPELASLITALHRCSQEQVPVTLIAAGLPQLLAQTGNAKSYAERLFDFPRVDALAEPAAREALEIPAAKEGVAFETEATAAILAQTQCYPYFLQEWGKHAWEAANASPITHADVVAGSELATAALDASFFLVRFDRLAPSEKRYLRAMAQLGPGPHRSGDIAAILDRPVTSLAPTRAALIAKGMVWSQAHGETAFTVPLFDAFMRRVMPGDDWRTTE
ncbi:MAG: ATP-binding protein [Proteobacteria bacterium]|nr:ATP-binding protein [Pseudomonadota bacterium]